MKLIKKRIDKTGNGAVVLVPQSDEDLWYIYNLLQKGDSMRTGVYRKVKSESKTGSITTEKVFFLMKMHITQINYYYGEESADVGLLIKGKNIEQNRFMQVGQMHTAKLDLNYPITIYKNHWDSLHMRTLKDSTDVQASADIAALVMDEGLANLCIVTNMTTLTKARIEKNIPKKFSGIFHYEKAIKQFFETILQAIINSIDFNVVKAFVIASPGFINIDFHKYLMEKGEKPDFTVIKNNKSKFILVKSSSGYKGALNEVLQDPAVLAKLKDTKAVKEIEILDKFYKMLTVDADRVAYGHKYVMEARDNDAISDLLICDTLFRTRNFGMRKEYVKLVDSVKARGGDVYIFSRSHVSGEKLNEISGIAAILRFPFNMDYLDEKEDTMEKQREEEEAKEDVEEDDDKLSDVASFVHDDDFDKEFFDTLEQNKTGHKKHHDEEEASEQSEEQIQGHSRPVPEDDDDDDN